MRGSSPTMSSPGRRRSCSAGRVAAQRRLAAGLNPHAAEQLRCWEVDRCAELSGKVPAARRVYRRHRSWSVWVLFVVPVALFMAAGIFVAAVLMYRPVAVWVAGIAALVTFGVGWFLGFVLAHRALRRNVRFERARMRCHRCQYDLHASIAGAAARCPECGAPIIRPLHAS